MMPMNTKMRFNGKIEAMNFPAIFQVAAMYEIFYPNAASCGELNPAVFAISAPHQL
jgi:hypothetical protein